MPLLELTASGLYCAEGDFYIDPWAPAERVILTHAHAAGAHRSTSYLTSKAGEPLLRAALGPDAKIESIEYGVPLTPGGVRVSLHPSGHILGSAQVRIEHGGEIWVVSGHYKLASDPTCAPFDPLRCHTLITEASYGLPIFRWRGENEIRAAIHAWWAGNRETGRSSLLFAHPVGKAQRLLALLDPAAGPIYCHPAVESINAIYRQRGIALAPTALAEGDRDWRRALVLAPPSTHGSAWARRFAPASTAMASGWMRIRGTRRRRSLDRGFTFSDHADWPGSLRALDEIGAERVWVTGRFRGPLARWIEEHGGSASAIEGQWEEAEQ